MVFFPLKLWTTLAAAAVLLQMSLTQAKIEQHPEYESASIIGVFPKDELQILYLKGARNKFDFWSEVKGIGDVVRIFAKKDAHEELFTMLGVLGIRWSYIEKNIRVDLLNSIMQNEEALSNLHSAHLRGSWTMTWEAYYSASDISRWIDSLTQIHGRIVQVTNVGKSYKSRKMKLVKISTGDSGKKPAMFIDGGYHAREWISPATVTFIINELLTNQMEHEDILNNVDFYFMPLVNPDGYEYSYETDRLWKKSRSRNPRSNCLGTDLNRNWAYKWMEAGSSDDPCNEGYAGKEPFSEVETRIVRDQMLKYKGSIETYISFYSYGQSIVYGSGYGAEDTEDVHELDALASKVSDAMKSVNGTRYTYGAAENVKYPVSGKSTDYAKTVAGIKYSYTIELRPKSWEKGGLFLHPSEIIPCAKESFEGFKVMARHLIKEKSCTSKTEDGTCSAAENKLTKED